LGRGKHRDDVEPAIALPVGERDHEAGHKFTGVVPNLHAHLRPCDEAAKDVAPKPEEAGLVIAAVIGAGQEVEPPIAIDVRQLRTEVGAVSAGGDAAVGAQLVEPDRRGELGPGRGAYVAVESHPALGAADQQVGAAVVVEIADRGENPPV
jgi:hypothetical protein